ncbi:MAG TPA: hypothetical protein VGR35_02180 [Tepidisphaeraceae bacterium]|nr:hypothetical protein [Tepidisphaeraceae bacterium]
MEEAARLLGRPVFFVDADGYECEIIGAAVQADGDIAYVESRSKDVSSHVDISIRIHLVRKSNRHDSADIESYNPYFGCDVRFFEWIDATAVLIYREKHWTFVCRFGDVWPPRFVKIEDDWVIDGNILSYVGYKEPVVRRLSFPALEGVDPIPVAEAFETDLFPAAVKERHNQTLQRTGAALKRSWLQRLFGRGPGR